MPLGAEYLNLLQGLIHSSKAFEFHTLLLEHLNVIPDNFDELINKLKGVFLTSDAAQKKRLLGLTTHERLKTAWIQTKSSKEVSELIKDLD